MTEAHPTESDRLLPNPNSDRKSYYYYEKNETQNRRGRLVIAGAASLALLFSAHSILPLRDFHHFHHRNKDIDFKPKDQIGTLQHLTEASLLKIAPTVANATPSKIHHHHSHSNGRVEVISDKKHAPTMHCTSQVMIMRHCDKQVKVGKRITDNRDKFGDRHCSAKGKARSEYIATLFVDPKDYQKLVKDNENEVTDGIPPVPMIKSSLAKVSSAAASKKPQFPSPLKLYALSSERPAENPSKFHENFREIETITPLSDKFHLDVDDRFGIEEEGDLASDFFENLSKSVKENVDMMLKTSRNEAGLETVSSLCNNGMTVVNWKHSRIPMLARALGCGTGQGCPKRYKGHDFDTVWLLTFQYSLLLEDIDKLNADRVSLALESLSASAQGSLRHRRTKSNGDWKITAELVNEGFEIV
eukprot:CAMPEP_0183730992 /NCGR_PEP_ID=MMETSP0737-20130205/34045_1 /TAXON_ID=385413 /ORGANISM="Thalassiosira miniscula, Strain CCMP1093" /LENGTH=415 /DNA_ID=CAMNT_0025963607 /DNA_START=202 /DNA_END=1449 /DNA_ORIENTATION=+